MNPTPTCVLLLSTTLRPFWQNEISGVVDLDEEVAVDREQTKEKHCHEHTTKVMVPEESPAVEDEKQKRELPATKEPVE